MIKEDLSIFKNWFIKITIAKNKEIPYLHGTFIAFLKYNDNLDSYILNHPLNIETNYVEAGESAFDLNDVKAINVVTSTELKSWVEHYNEFHMRIMKEKGYDPCEIEKGMIPMKLN